MLRRQHPASQSPSGSHRREAERLPRVPSNSLRMDYRRRWTSCRRTAARLRCFRCISPDSAAQGLPQGRHWSRAIAHTATAGTSARAPTAPQARSRGRACPGDDSGRAAPGPSSRPPTGRNGQLPRRRIRSRLADGGNPTPRTSITRIGKRKSGREPPAEERTARCAFARGFVLSCRKRVPSLELLAAVQGFST